MPPPYAKLAVAAGFGTLGEAAVYRREGFPDLPLTVLAEREVEIVGIGRAEAQQQGVGYHVYDADLAAAGLSPPLRGDVIELLDENGGLSGDMRQVQGEPQLVAGNLKWRLDTRPVD